MKTAQNITAFHPYLGEHCRTPQGFSLYDVTLYMIVYFLDFRTIHVNLLHHVTSQLQISARSSQTATQRSTLMALTVFVERVYTLSADYEIRLTAGLMPRCHRPAMPVVYLIPISCHVVCIYSCYCWSLSLSQISY